MKWSARIVGVAVGAALIAAPAWAATINGTSSNDTLRGTNSADAMRGYGGADRQFGRGGNDRQYGGPGNDRQYGQAGNDRAWGGAGNDKQYGQGGNDKQYGQAGRDLLVGGPGNDLLVGGPGKDVHRGGPGNDTLRLIDNVAEVGDCGSGARDVIYLGVGDTAKPNCEILRGPGAIERPGNGPPGVATTPTPAPETTPGDIYNCADFPLADGTTAQEYLKRFPSDPSRLDGNNDGVACQQSACPWPTLMRISA